MQNRVDELLGKEVAESQLRYVVYSAHDDQISNMVEWMHPKNFEFDFVIYASQIAFELKYDSDCLAQKASEKCFEVGFRVNGEEIGFEQCLQREGCSYPNFKKLMQDIWYDGKYSPDLDQACQQPTIYD